MPFYPVAKPDDYPEREQPRRPWDEWGPQEQEANLMEAVGIKDDFTQRHRDTEGKRNEKI